MRVIDTFFTEQNLTLPPGKTWRHVTANIFREVDGKRILFEDKDSLFHRLHQHSPSTKLIREEVALNMVVDEIHEDVHHFMEKLLMLTVEK